MFVFLILLILNIQKLIAANEIKTGNKNKESIINMLHRIIGCEYPADRKARLEKEANFRSGQIIAKLIFDSVLKKITFPLKMQTSWPIDSKEEEYEIQKTDIKFDLYVKALVKETDRIAFSGKEKDLVKETDNIACSGKEKALRILVYSLANQTKPLFNAIKNANVSPKELHYDIISKNIS
ncbi:putative SP-containing protein [Vairimorpha necatrix]|uniref:SP-containing protein n=1 Tax=Vairimorpha necatrix TaxID=6039 RepID=A0AAX4J853_9MICR